MSMKALAILAVLLFLISCVPVQREYYLPINEEDAHETKSCGSVPGGGYSKEIAQGARLAVSGTKTDNDLWLYFQFDVADGYSLKFESNKIRVSAGGSTSREETINHDSGEEYPSLNPMEPMIGGTQQLYMANLKVPNFNHNRFTLKMPSANLNSQEYMIDPIDFYLVSRKGVMTCIQ